MLDVDKMYSESHAKKNSGMNTRNKNQKKLAEVQLYQTANSVLLMSSDSTGSTGADLAVFSEAHVAF